MVLDNSTENGIGIVKNIDQVAPNPTWTPSPSASGIDETYVERNGHWNKALNFTCTIKRPFQLQKKPDL